VQSPSLGNFYICHYSYFVFQIKNVYLIFCYFFRSSIFEFSSTRPCFGCENDPLVIFSRLPPNAKQIWVNKATEILERSKSQTWEYLAEEELLEDTNVELFKVCAKSIERFNAKHQNYATKWELFLVFKLLLRSGSYQIICVSLLSVDWSSWMECRRNYGPVFADWNRLYGILFLHAAALGGFYTHWLVL
jgi:hypothetical protein